MSTAFFPLTACKSFVHCAREMRLRQCNDQEDEGTVDCALHLPLGLEDMHLSKQKKQESAVKEVAERKGSIRTGSQLLGDCTDSLRSLKDILIKLMTSKRVKREFVKLKLFKHH